MMQVSRNMVQVVGTEKVVQVGGSQHGCMSPDDGCVLSLNADARGFSFGGTRGMGKGRLAMYGAMENAGS